MNNFTERTWTMVTISEAIKKLMKTYVEYPPRKLQSATYTGPDHHHRTTSGSSGSASSSPRRASTCRCRPATDGWPGAGRSGPPPREKALAFVSIRLTWRTIII